MMLRKEKKKKKEGKQRGPKNLTENLNRIVRFSLK